MQINFDRLADKQISYLVGNSTVLENMKNIPVLPMFSEDMLAFLAKLSQTLIEDKRTRAYVDIISYAYWIRKASLEREKGKYQDRDVRMGRGVAFHIAPSNVPVNFAVSMTSALLAGNGCIIRVSDKTFPQVTLICEAINKLLQDEFAQLVPYFCIIRYPHDEEITEYLSSICDIRIIWGGDQTISKIRKANLPPRAIELTFADRYSLAIIDADVYLEADEKQVADGFYTDTYYTDQNACSSPRMIIWMGHQIEQAKKQFWDALKKKVQKEYEIAPIVAVDKYAMFCSLAMKGIPCQWTEEDDGRLMRVKVEQLSEELMEYKYGAGYFFEYEASVLEEIVPLLGKRCQTVSVLGVSKTEIYGLVLNYGVRGVDRIVDLGQTMGLEFVWDGFKMIEAMSRVVYIDK